MKAKARLLLYTLVALLFISCAGPQETRSLPNGLSDAQAPSEATTVTVATEAAPQKAYQAAARVLQSEGYALENTDSDLRSITTGRKSAEPNGILVGLPEHRLTVAVTANPTTVELRGTTFRAGSQDAIKKYGQSGSPMRLAWARLVTIGDEVAERTDGKLSYQE